MITPNSNLKWITLLISVGFLFSKSPVFANENKQLDSLVATLKTNLTEEQRIINLSEISWQYLFSNVQLSKKYAEEELQIAIQLKNNKYIAQARNDLGGVLFRLGEYRNAITQLNSALAIRKNLKDESGMASVYSKLGLCYDELANYNAALENQLAALRIFEKEKSDAKISYTLNNLCGIYRQLKYFDKFLETLKKAKLLCEKTGDKRCLGNIYNNQAEYFNHNKDYASAIFFHKKATEIMIEIGDSNNLAISYSNWASILQKTDKINEAESKYKMAITIAEKLNDANEIALFSANLAIFYNNQKKFKQALQFADISEKIATEKKISVILKKVYRAKTIANAGLKNGMKAILYFTLFNELTDSLFSKDLLQQVSNQQVNYETEKQINENKLLQKDNQLKENLLQENRWILYAISITALFIVIVILFFYFRRMEKEKTKLIQERMLQKEQKVLAVMDAEIQERQRIARELHDGIGQQLSAAKLTLAGISSEDSEHNLLINNVIQLVDDAVSEIRTVSHSMMANALTKNGLEGAVRDFVHKLSLIKNIEIQLEIVGLSVNIVPEKESFIFRILQEIVSNAIKHGEAKLITIQLITHDGELVLLVEDNGKGFDSSKVNEANGIGLKNLYSRVEYLNGTIDFDSFEGKGTTVSVNIPL